MKKLYSIEFLRVWLTVLVIIGHTIFVPEFRHFFAGSLLSPMGSFVDLFFIIAGFFLYQSYNNNINNNVNYLSAFAHRAKRLLPALISYKVASVLFFGASGTYILSNIFMFNMNTGLDIPTQTHIIWFVDVMFIVYIFYMTMLYVMKQKQALFLVFVLTYLSLCILFMHPDVNFHFQYALSFLDGGVLRGIAFMGMGILLSAIPYKDIKFNNYGKILISLLEIVSIVMAFFYLRFSKISSGIVFNYALWTLVFIFFYSRQYGYVSQFINKQSWINYISKYCYETYVFQFFAIELGYKWFSPHQAPVLTGFMIILLSFVFGKIFKDYVEPLLFKSAKLLLCDKKLG